MFFDAQRESVMKLSVTLSEKDELSKKNENLRNEVHSHKMHIRSLKERVSALFQQDVSNDEKVCLMMKIT